MALFLQETNAPVAVAAPAPSLFEAMDALLEYTHEQANMNEALLRADFIIHTQTTALREAATPEGAADADKKEGGFLKQAWEMLKALIKKCKDAVITVYNWIKSAVQRFWAAVKAKAQGAYAFVMSKGKVAWLKAKKLLLQARIKFAMALYKASASSGGWQVSENEVKSAEAACAKALGMDEAQQDIEAAEIEDSTRAGSEGAAEVLQMLKQFESAANEMPADKAAAKRRADGLKRAVAEAHKAASDAAQLTAKALSAKAKAKKAAAAKAA